MPMDVHLDDGSITGPDGLLERLQTLTDPRARRGKRHRLAGLLAIAAAAVLGGARSYTAIAEFASELDAATLARPGTWRRPYSDCWIPPSEATLRRTLQQVDADALDRLVGDWLADQQPPAQAGDQPAAVAVDGKALRGAVGPDGQQVHLLEPLDLQGKVVTADALHTQAKHARWLVDDEHADYLLTVKGNQPGLQAQIDRLAPDAFSPGAPHR